MRTKKSLTIVERATILVPEFNRVYKQLSEQVTLRGQSQSTLENYIRRIALFVIHFGILLPALQLNTTIVYVILEIIIFLAAKKTIKTNTIVIEGLLLGKNSMIFFLITIAILTISIFISSYFYKKREFVRR